MFILVKGHPKNVIHMLENMVYIMLNTWGSRETINDSQDDATKIYSS